MKMHAVRGAAASGCTCASGARRTDHRSCSSTAGRKTISAGRRQYERALADEFRLAAPDLRGHGMPEGPLDKPQGRKRPRPGPGPSALTSSRGRATAQRTTTASRTGALGHIDMPRCAWSVQAVGQRVTAASDVA